MAEADTPTNQGEITVELPIAQESYQPAPAALVRAVRRARVILARTAADEAGIENATAFIRPDRPSVSAINLVADLALDDDISEADAESWLDTVDAHFETSDIRCLRLAPSEAQPPPALIEAAAKRGYTPRESNLFLLTAYQHGAHDDTQLQIIPARAAYPQLPALFEQSAPNSEGAKEIARTRIDYLDEPRLDVFLGRVDDRSAGFVSLLSLGQIGLIESVFTTKDYRRRGVAMRLLDHAIELCERAQFEQVIAALPQGDEAATLFERMGFTAIARYTDLIRS